MVPGGDMRRVRNMAFIFDNEARNSAFCLFLKTRWIYLRGAICFPIAASGGPKYSIYRDNGARIVLFFL